MERIQYHRYGGPEVMRLETYELPEPAKDEIVVKVKASSVNPVDWKVRQGLMKLMTGRKLPRAMGTDFSGVVLQVGKDVTRFHLGDEVFGTVPLKSSGAFSEMLITKEKLAVKKPHSISHEQAATLPVVCVTAWRGLVQKGKLKEGDNVFINGAFGGVGQAVVYIAKAIGASVTARVGPNTLADAQALGVDRVLDYTKNIPTNLHQSFDIVFDCHGSLTQRDSNALIKRKGTVVDPNPTAYKFIRSLYSSRFKLVIGTQDTSTLQKIADLAATEQLAITIGRTVMLNEAIALIADLEAGRRTKGKAVIITT